MDVKNRKIPQMGRNCVCITSSFPPITLGLNPFRSSSYQTWRLQLVHTIFGQRALEVINRCEFECDSGSELSLLSCSRWCLLRAGRLAKPAGRAGWAELPVGPACPHWTWQGGEKFHRSVDSQENLTTSCWHQQNHSSHPYQAVWSCAWGSDCLRFLV